MQLHATQSVSSCGVGRRPAPVVGLPALAARKPASRAVLAPALLAQHVTLRGAVRMAGAEERGTAVATAESGAPEGPFEITLRGSDALKTVLLGLVPDGKGQAVVVTGVEPGSQAEQMGVRRGQKLNALSDPLRYGQMWSLLDRPSLRFVVDTFKMRRAQPIDLEFEAFLGQPDMDAIFGPDAGAVPVSPAPPPINETQPWLQGSPAASPAASASPSAPASPASRSADGREVSQRDSAADLFRDSVSSLDSMLGTASESDANDGMTIGERLAAKHAAAEKGRMSVNQVQARIDRRKAYMEIDDKRDDTALLLGLAAAFLLPALAILGYAFASGYLDHLYGWSLTIS